MKKVNGFYRDAIVMTFKRSRFGCYTLVTKPMLINFLEASLMGLIRCRSKTISSGFAIIAFFKRIKRPVRAVLGLVVALFSGSTI